MFERASAVEPAGDGQFTFQVDPSWYQGPGAFGGLTAGAVLRAMMRLEPDRPPRAFTIQFCAPVPAGTNTIETRLERKGSSMSFLSARVLHRASPEEPGQVCATAVASLGRDRPAARELDFDEHQAPEVARPSLDELSTEPPPSPPFPAFLRHFRLKFALGSFPGAGAPEARVGAWLRSTEAEPVDYPLAAALLDVMPPALLVKVQGFRAMSSVSISFHFLAPLPDPALDPEAPMLVDVRSRVAFGGYSDQEGRLYSPQGKLYAVARQVVAVFG